MSSVLSPLPRFGIVTALPAEHAAMKAMLDDPFEHFVPDDLNTYWIGSIPAAGATGNHQLVLTLMPKMGNNSAAAAVTNLCRSFPSVQEILMVGIACGVPDPSHKDKHVRLGDVVVSDENGVVQYDNGKLSSGTFEIKSSPQMPSALLVGRVKYLESEIFFKKFPWDRHIDRALQILNCSQPDPLSDRLFCSNDPKTEISHPSDSTRSVRAGRPKIHTGKIGSANTLLKDPKKRDLLRDTLSVRAIEMEGSGIADGTWEVNRGYILVRGICDYGDSHKNDDWHVYAAIVAAAYARALLESIPAPVASKKRKKSGKKKETSLQVDNVELPAIEKLKELQQDSLERARLPNQVDGLRTPQIHCPENIVADIHPGTRVTITIEGHPRIAPAQAPSAEDSKDQTDQFNRNIARLLESGQLVDALAALQNPGGGVVANSETDQVHALTLALNGDTTSARLKIESALQTSSSRALRFTAATIGYFGCLSPAALPNRPVPWPGPVDACFVKTDDASQACLQRAEAEFANLASEAGSKEKCMHLKVWRLACLANSRSRLQEATEFCRELLAEYPNSYPVLAWALARRLASDLATSRKILEQELGIGDKDGN